MAYQAPLSIGFSRQEYWGGLPFPSPGDLPDLGIKPSLLYCRQTVYQLSFKGSPKEHGRYSKFDDYHSVQFSSVAQLCSTLCDPMNRSTPGLPVHHQLPEFKLMSIESVMPSSHLILCHPLLLLPLIPPSIRVLSKESTLPMRWPKYWSFNFNISPSNEYLGLISFRMDWLDLLAVQGTHKSSPTPQFKSIDFLALSFLHNPTLTSIHDHWKNHSLD